MIVRAEYKLIEPNQQQNKHLRIQIHCNKVDVKVQDKPHPPGKYKKVNKAQRDQLILLVKQGSSIISAAKELQINYSTAKSIFQNLKIKKKRKRRAVYMSENSSQLQSHQQFSKQ